VEKTGLRAHIVSQTHWDREWYLPFEEFRFRLVRLMDRVLHLFETQPEYRHFVCDGQTILLDDYLAIRPEKEDVLRQHIQSGRLVIGPWHVLPDEFIVSGESLIRNLLMARRVARRFGKLSGAGYVPDPFGHVAQLPQILRGFGIDTFIFLRGMPQAEKWGTEFFWEAPDKQSTVLAIWMKNIYFNASLLGYESGWGDSERMTPGFRMEKALEQLRAQVEDLGKWTRRGTILLNNGCDHTLPQYEIPEIIAAANAQIPEATFIHSTYDAFAEEVKSHPGKLRTMRGVELRSGRYIVILPGVLSARMNLKQWNRECESLLERWAEPAVALLRHLGGEDHAGSLIEAWRLLLENHPHDSICGCSVDAVHREMVTRFEKVEQIGRTLLDFHLGEFESRIDTRHPKAAGAIVSWNSLFTARRGPLAARLQLPAEKLPENFRLVDATGHAVPFQLSSVDQYDETTYLSFNKPMREVELLLDAEQAGWGHRVFHVLTCEGEKKQKGLEWCRKASEKGIETEHLKLKFHTNGSFDLLDKASGVRHRNLMIFEDVEDAGDEYDWSHAPKGKRFTTEKAKAHVELVTRGPVAVEYAITIPWRLPEGLTANRKRRSRQMVDADISILLRVSRSSARVDVAVRFFNMAHDHRLRVLFTGPSHVAESVADGHFATVRRPIDVETTPQHDGQEPTTHHMRHWVALHDGEKGLAVLNSRLTEYEIVKGPGGARQIAVTLLRSVGWLSRKDLLTRPNFAGPMIETPEAQGIGFYETEFALLPVSGKTPERQIIPEAEFFAVPVMMRWADCHEGSLPADHSWLTVGPDHLVGSAWKPAEQGPGSVLRFANTTDKAAKATISVAEPLVVEGACDLKEESIGVGSPMGGERGHVGEVGAYRIESLRIGGASPWPPGVRGR
jgi:alpha-mannosidase